MTNERTERGRHLRLLRGGRRDVADDDDRRHHAEVFRIEQEILALLRVGKWAMAGIAKVVELRLAPVDAHAAEIFLDEIARGELP
jgi:hypothetical protein